MASIKVFLKDKANKHGKYPLTIRIIKNRKPSYIFTGHYIDKTEWDEIHQRVRKSHITAKTINNDLTRQVAEANNRLVELNFEQRDLISQKKVQHSFFGYADAYLDNLEKSKKFNQHSADKSRVKHFKEFTKGQDIGFNEINPSLLKRFQAHLKHERDVSRRTIVNHLVVIRTIFNTAIKDHPPLSKYYPFGKGKIQIKFPETKKVGLTKEELERFEKLELDSGSSHWHSRNVWLFAFYFAGMRVADVLTITWDDLRDNRLHYGMSKNDKVGSLAIPAKALAIIEQYKNPLKGMNDYVFPDLEKADRDDEKDIHRKIKTAIRKFNDDLREMANMADIDKPLTNHIARHTFGNISGDKIPPHMLQKLYRHSSLTTTIGYQSNFIFKDADDALKSVIGN